MRSELATGTSVSMLDELLFLCTMAAPIAVVLLLVMSYSEDRHDLGLTPLDQEESGFTTRRCNRN